MRHLLLAVLLAATPAWAGDVVQFGSASCTVTGRPEIRKTKSGRGRSLVVCQAPAEDVTGDGLPEIAEATMVLKRNGSLECGASSVVTLDSTLLHQAISVAGACGD